MQISHWRRSSLRVTFGIRRVVLKAGPRIELQPAGRQPIAKQCGPGFTYTLDIALEGKHGIAAACDGCLLRAPEATNWGGTSTPAS